jgi:hypothetical protein
MATPLVPGERLRQLNQRLGIPMSHLSRPRRGQQRDKPYREVLRMEHAAAGEDMMALREIAKVHIAKCKEGDTGDQGIG